MKRTISILLVLLICLGMCACGSESSKYVGTYTSGGDVTVKRGTYTPIISTQKTMTLHADGTGYIEEVLSESFDNDSIGTVIKKYDVSWQDDGTYITIKTTLTYHKYMAIDYFGAKVGLSTSATYELKGTQLFLPNESFARGSKES